MKTVLILVDALKSSYLTSENMPYLYSLISQSIYVKNVIPSFGFCERSEIFTGMTPELSGNFLAIGRDKEKSEYKKYKSILRFFNMIDKYNSRYARKVLSILAHIFKIKLKPYYIPLNMLDNYVLTEDGEHSYGVSVESIFTVAKEEDIKISLEAFTSLNAVHRLNNQERIEHVKSCASNDIEFIPLYLGELDQYGHLYGNDVDFMKPYLKNTDNIIKEINEKYKKHTSSYNLIVLGDHGMVPVTENINIESKMNNLKVKNKINFEMFLDSTVARFWVNNEETKRMIMDELNDKFSMYGFILDSESAKKLHVPLSVRSNNNSKLNLYGDIIWCAKNGVLISPDYFNRGKEIKGMHGYADTDSHTNGLLIITGSHNNHYIKEECRLIDICPTLCDLINIRYPDGNIGKSVIDDKNILN